MGEVQLISLPLVHPSSAERKPSGLHSSKTLPTTSDVVLEARQLAGGSTLAISVLESGSNCFRTRFPEASLRQGFL